MAFETNPTLAGQKARDRAATERLNQAKSAYGPSIDARASYLYQRERSNSPFGGDAEGAQTSYSVTVSQPLFTFGRLAANVSASQAERLAERERVRLAEQTLIAETVTAYVAVQRDLAIYAVRMQIAALLDEQFTMTEKRLDLRAATATDVQQIDTQRRLARALGAQARARLQRSAYEYRRIVGRFPHELAPLPELPALPPLETLLRTSDGLSPQIGIAALSAQAARELLALRRAERMPTVSAEVGASRNPFAQFDRNFRALRSFAGLSVTIPIFRGGELGASIREANGLLDAAQADYEEVRRQVRAQISSLRADAEAASDAAPLYAEAVQSGEAALRNARRQERAGLRSAREVIEITNDLLLARINAISAAANGYTSAVMVLFNAGMLDVASFGAQVEPYDAQGYDPFEAGFAGLPFRPVLAPLDKVFVERRSENDLVLFYEGAGEFPVPPAATRDPGAAREAGESAPASPFPAPRFAPQPQAAAIEEAGSD